MIKLLEMWKSALLYNFLVIVFFQFLILPSFAQNLGKPSEATILASDRLALKVGKSVFFLSDIKEILNDLKSIKCLKFSLALSATNLNVHEFSLKDDFAKSLENKKLLSQLINYIKIKEHVNMTKIEDSKNIPCKDKLKTSVNIQEFLKVEYFLRSRFMKSNAIDQSSLKSFFNNSIQKINYEVLL